MRLTAILALTAAAVLAAAAPARADVLIDQTGSPLAYSSGSSVSYTDQTADDVTVPVGSRWTVSEIDASGNAYGTPPAPQSIDVSFYADATGAPGAEVFHQTVSIASGWPNLTLALAPAAVLTPGTYWLSVRAGLNGGGIPAEWFWTDRSVVVGAPAMRRSFTGSTPGAWMAGSPAADEIFRVLGTSGPDLTVTPVATASPVPVTAPVATPTPTPAPAPAAPTVPKFADVVTLPPAKSCVSRRTLRITLHTPKGTTLKRATVAIGSHKPKVVSGKALKAPVDLRGLPRGTYTVKVTVTLSDSRVVKGTRRYRTCAATHKT